MKVSVLITSYNHAHTLRRAIDSVLMQKTDFDVQVIIVDDGSTDGSIDIIEEYYNRPTDRFYINVLEGEHCGMMRAYLEGFKRCSGEYITLCDCDDYWLVPDRLQRYVDHMDAHPEVGFCTSRIITERNGKKIDTSFNKKEAIKRLTFDNLLRGNAYLYAQGYFIRKSVFDKWIDFNKFARWFYVWDYPIVLELIRRTKFDQIDYVTAVYTVEGESKTNTRSRRKRWIMIWGQMKIRSYYILKYGCKLSTASYVIYKFTRDVISVILKRWTKN